MVTPSEFDKLIVEFPEANKAYCTEKSQILDEQLAFSSDFIAHGHHSACECGCMQMTALERHKDLERKILSDYETQILAIDGFYDEPIDGVIEIFVDSKKGGIEYGKVFVGCSEILRYQTDEEYDWDDIKTLIFRAMRTDFDPTKYPEVTDEDEMAELEMEFVGEPIDISVPITDIHREKLSKYGVVKDYCLYGSIYG